jgi:uncharacterized membrane protein YfcA
VPTFDIPLWGALALAAAIVGFSKTGIQGTSALAIVLFAAVLPARASTGALLPVLIAGDLLASRVYRHHVEWRLLLRLSPGVVIGTALGAVALSHADDATMRVAIGGILLAMLGTQLLMKRKRSPAESAIGTELPGGLRKSAASGAGVAAGATTMIANAAGPVMVLYLTLAGLPKLRFLGTTAWFFMALNLFKLPISVGLGLITWPTLILTLTLLPAVGLGAWLGIVVAHRVDQKHFELATLAFSGIGAALLII